MPIHLQPQDWLWATWRNMPPLPVPAPNPFNLDARMEEIQQMEGYWYWWHQPLRQAKSTMSRIEAHFWLEFLREVMTTNKQSGMSKQFFSKPTPIIDGNISGQEVTSILTSTLLSVAPPLTMAMAWTLLSTTEFFNFLANFSYATAHGNAVHNIREGLYTHVMPYLTDEQRTIGRDQVRQRVTDIAADVSLRSWAQPHLTALCAAAMLGGFSSEIQQILQRIPDNYYLQHQYMNFIEIIYGLDDPELVEREARRLAHPLLLKRHLVGWLAHTETQALDYIYDAIVQTRTRGSDAVAAFNALTQVEDAAIVPYMMSMTGKTPLARRAAAWLNKNELLAAQGAAQMYLAGGVNSQKARNHLRALHRKGATELLNAVHDGLPDEQRARFKTDFLDLKNNATPLTSENVPDWLREALAVPFPVGVAKRKTTLNAAPNWVNYTELPALVLTTGETLPVEYGDHLLAALKHSTLEQAHPMVTGLKAHVSDVVLDKFVCALFMLWQQRGEEIKDKWVLYAVGWLGGDVATLRLTSYIKNMPRRLNSRRAIIAVACIGAIATDTALMQLTMLASLPGSTRGSSMKTEAQRAIERIAQERHLTPDELADSTVPTFGLNPDGKWVFDYGVRQFKGSLNEHLKPFIRSSNGKVMADLPKPTQKDDPQRAEQALLEWRSIKQQVKAATHTQTERLEMAMVYQRLWQAPQFERWFVQHPLMSHLTRRLIWGAYCDAGSKPHATFRVTEERDFATLNDQPLRLQENWMIGVVHPIHLTEAESDQWGNVFRDYELIPPFQQLGRRIYTLSEEQLSVRTIIHYQPTSISSQVFFGMLSSLRWQGGYGPTYNSYYWKTYPYLGVGALISYQRDYDGAQWERQRIEKVLFLPYEANGDIRPLEDAIRLRDVPAIALSETLRDVESLISRGGAK